MGGADARSGHSKRGGGRKVAEPTVASYADTVEDLSPKALTCKIKELEMVMYKHSRDLEFEEAARVRDQLTILKRKAFVS